ISQLAQEEENDDANEVTWEDQKKINTFSKLNTRIQNIKEKMEELMVQKEALDDLANELELVDEDEPVLYKVGEAFLHLSHPRAVRRLTKDTAAVDQEIATLVGRSEACEEEMKQLKVALYAKFGSAINLDE
ncbi:Prefoldin, subunit 4, partial [Auriscalpium vulgare]